MPDPHPLKAYSGAVIQATRGAVLLQSHVGPGSRPSSLKVVPGRQWRRSPEVTQGPAKPTGPVEECLPRSCNQGLGEEGMPTEGRRPGVVSCAHGINNPLDKDVLLCKSHRGPRGKAAAATYPWVWACSLVLTLVFPQKPGLLWSVKYPYYLCIGRPPWATDAGAVAPSRWRQV